MLWIVLIASMASPSPAQSTQSAGNQQDCIDFTSRGRVKMGAEFSVPLLRNLELRLDPHLSSVRESYGWSIRVAPVGEQRDFMWVVSPPFRFAPHSIIGAGYGLTARESARIQRAMHFVLDRRDYDEAAGIVEREPASGAKWAKLERLAKGSLFLTITNYELRENIKTPEGRSTDGFEWIEFEGRACVPRLTQ